MANVNDIKEKGILLTNIHIFRAFAIFNVMMVHLWASGMHSPPFGIQLGMANLCRAIFFGNSTIYFIFISGFLFEYLSKNFQINKYYEKKIKYVVAPYIVISLVMTITPMIKESLFDGQIFSFIAFLTKYCSNIIYGRASFQFWYIPFIIIVFLISPLLLKVPSKYDKIIIVLSALLPLIGTRTATKITLYQFVYFVPLYILGFYTSKYYLYVDRIKNYKSIFLIISIIVTIILFSIYQHNITAGSFSLNESVFYIQKISLTIYLIFKLKEVDLNNSFNLIANYSFALFFLHMCFAKYTLHPILQLIDDYLRNFSFILSLLVAFFYILLTIFIIGFLRKIFGSYSRYIIGA